VGGGCGRGVMEGGVGVFTGLVSRCEERVREIIYKLENAVLSIYNLYSV